MPAVVKKLLAVFSLLISLGILAGPAAGFSDLRAEQPRNVLHGGVFRTNLPLLPDGETSLEEAIALVSSRVEKDLAGISFDPAAVEKEITRLADRIRPVLAESSDPRTVIASMNRVLFDEEGFTYDGLAENPDNYLLDRVIARKKGNCLGLTTLYLLLAERLSLPLRGVYVPSHTFVRYEDKGVRINIETGEKGAEWEDDRYARKFRIGREGPYLRSLNKKEMVAVFLASAGATYSRKGRDDEALVLYREASLLYPTLPAVYFNIGVSYHKKGRIDEAIAQYGRALDLDPVLVVARDNLGLALSRNGRFSDALAEARKATSLSPGDPVSRGHLAAALFNLGMVEEGLREYHHVLDIDPDNAKALVELTNAHYARGEFHEAIVYCDRAMERGYRFDPVVLGTLEMYRDPPEDSLP